MPRLRDRLAAARAAWRTGRSPWTASTAARSRATGAGRGRRLHPAQPAPPGAGRAATTRDLVLTLFLGVTALTAVAAVLFTAQSLGATRDQLRLSERAQISDRFSRAIDQLGQEGPDKLSIRLGGIYALEHLMRDSPTDAPTVIEVLCAFVRTHAPRPDQIPRRIPPSPPDVWAAVVVLGRRPNPTGPETMHLDLNSSLLSLPGADLADANLAARTWPTRTWPARPWPTRIWSARTWPTRTYLARTCPTRTCPTRTCPTRTCPTRTWPTRTWTT